MSSNGDADRAWLEAIAAATPPSADGETVVFHEERRDGSVSGALHEEPAERHSWWSGLSVERGRRMAYLSGATPADALPLVRGLASGAPRMPARRRVGSPSFERGDAVDTVRAVLDALRAAAPGADARVRWTGSRQTVHVSSDDGPLVDRRSGQALRIELRLRDGRRSAFAVAESADVAGGPAGLAPLVEAVIERAAARLAAAPAPVGERELIFTNGSAGVLLHELVGHALEGDLVAAGATWLAGDVELAPTLTVIDDPRRARIAWNVDDEGTPVRIAPLVRDGRPVGALTDRRCAGALARARTGHARRATYRDRAMPRMGCTFAAAGRDTRDGLVADVTDGILVRRLEAGTTDVARGIAWFRVDDADRVVRGRLTGPLEPFVLLVDGARSLRAPHLRVADDVTFHGTLGHCLRRGQSVVTSVGAPTIWIGLGGYAS